MSLLDIIQSSFLESLNTKKSLIDGDELKKLVRMSEVICTSIINGGKLLIAGNGGSAADAQHLVAEMMVRLKSTNNRRPLPAISLVMDSSTMTACSNDFSFDEVFSRNLEAIGKPNDVFLAITTSGNSNNLCEALSKAKTLNIHTLSFLGGTGGQALTLSELYFLVPSKNTARIQESHITAGHCLIEAIENNLYKQKYL